MSHLVEQIAPVILAECPEKWTDHKDDPGLLLIYACDGEERIGKYWFRFLHDETAYNVQYLRSSWGDMTKEEDGTVAFDTKNGSHYLFVPVLDMQEEKPDLPNDP